MYKNKEQIDRLLNYRSLLYRLQSLGFKKVFSDNIADTLEISSSLVRKDFGKFGISGTQKGGYTIENILKRLHKILGKNEIQKVIVIGAGRIGEAIMKYKDFTNEGIEIVAGFDIDSSKLSEKAEIPIYSIEKLSNYISNYQIKFAIMAVPKMAAQQIFEMLVLANIKGILNFTNLKIMGTETTIVSNINIVHELENLIYLVNHSNNETEKPT